MWSGLAWWGTPSPSVYRNDRVSGKWEKRSWGTIICAQNLDLKELSSLKSGLGPKTGYADSAHRHGRQSKLFESAQGLLTGNPCSLARAINTDSAHSTSFLHRYRNSAWIRVPRTPPYLSIGIF